MNDFTKNELFDLYALASNKLITDGYTSKTSLLMGKIQSLIEKFPPECKDECEHESDGDTYYQKKFYSKIATPPLYASSLLEYKCKKCGELYR